MPRQTTMTSHAVLFDLRRAINRRIVIPPVRSTLQRGFCLAVILGLPGLCLAHLENESSEFGGSDAQVDSRPAIGGESPEFAHRIAHLEGQARSGEAAAANWVRLGDALMQASRESLNPGDYMRAEQAYERALELEPRNVEALLGLAWVHNTEHAFDDGNRFARAALAINPRLPEAYALLGDAAVEFGDYDTAFEHYQEALDLRPDLSSYSRAAHLLWLTGNAVKARWLMRKAVDAGGPHAENTAWCRAQLALMSLEAGAVLSAEGEIKLALVASPRNPHVLAAAGRIQTAREEFEAAIESYRQSIASAPTHDALAALVDLYELTGRPDEAQTQFARVVEFHAAHNHHGDNQDHAHIHAAGAVEPDSADGPSTDHHNAHTHPHGDAPLARFYADHNRNLDEALREAQAACDAFPNIQTADTLAWCLYRKGEFKEAAKMIRRALRPGTPDASIHFHAGMIQARLGNRPLAQKYLYQALSLNPRFHPIQAQLAVDTLDALADRSRAISMRDASSATPIGHPND